MWRDESSLTPSSHKMPQQRKRVFLGGYIPRWNVLFLPYQNKCNSSPDIKNSAPTSLLSLAASIAGTVISAGLRLVLPCYWCCSIRPFKKQAHVGHGRENEKNLVCFGCDFSGWNCGHQVSYLKLKCTKFDFGWRSAHTALAELTALPQPPSWI